MRYMLVFTLYSCSQSTPLFNREQFEDKWWQLEEYSICFNFHESGDLLSYQEQSVEENQWRRFIDEGEWVFCEPNEYSVADETIFVFEDGDCWEIEGYYNNRNITACECAILQLDTN